MLARLKVHSSLTSTMIFKTVFLVVSLVWSVQSKPTTKDTPVDVINSVNIVIDGYNGVMDTNTMELFPNIESLTFRNCNFSLFNENFLNHLKNIQKLTFANDQFRGFISDNTSEPCCEKLHELLMLDGGEAPYSEEEFKLTAEIKALERLYFLRMYVPTLYANALNGSNVKKLEVMYSGLVTIQDGALNGMDKLEVLDLQHNKLKSIPTASLAAVKTLKELNLENNHLEKITAADIPSLPNLEKLNLGHNPIKEIDLTGVKEKLPKIKQIDCSGVNIDLSKAEGLPILKTQVL